MTLEGGFQLIELRARLQAQAENELLNYFGVADLTPVMDYVCIQGGKFLTKFPRAISIGIDLLDEVLDQLTASEVKTALTYLNYVYQTVNVRLNLAAMNLGSTLQKNGYGAYLIPASQTLSYESLTGLLSHKLVAHLAGLGWIGKSSLLVTPNHGPRVRFSTILTDAPLPAGQSMSSRCGKCAICVTECPSGAITGEPFRPEDELSVRFQANLCNSYAVQKKRDWGGRTAPGDN